MSDFSLRSLRSLRLKNLDFQYFSMECADMSALGNDATCRVEQKRRHVAAVQSSSAVQWSVVLWSNGLIVRSLMFFNTLRHASCAIPASRTTIPVSRTAVPADRTTVPEGRTAVPSSGTTSPARRNACSALRTASPTSENAVPVSRNACHGSKIEDRRTEAPKHRFSAFSLSAFRFFGMSAF